MQGEPEELVASGERHPQGVAGRVAGDPVGLEPGADGDAGDLLGAGVGQSKAQYGVAVGVVDPEQAVLAGDDMGGSRAAVGAADEVTRGGVLGDAPPRTPTATTCW